MAKKEKGLGSSGEKKKKKKKRRDGGRVRELGREWRAWNSGSYRYM